MPEGEERAFVQQRKGRQVAGMLPRGFYDEPELFAEAVAVGVGG